MITSAKLNTLIAKLQQDGMLDAEAFERINHAAAHPLYSAIRELDRVGNVDKLLVGP